MALALPSITAGLVADDWLQLLVARGRIPWAGVTASRFDLFSFAGHDPRMTPRLVDAGLFPWWTDPAVKLAFWRPLSSATHVLDWVLWPESPALMHLHSLVWFALALVAVAALYRRLFGAFGDDQAAGDRAPASASAATVDALAAAAAAASAATVGASSAASASAATVGASLATLLYALDDAHGPAVGWIANRNAMIAVAAALPVLLVHDRWRRLGWRAGAVVAPLALGVALLAGESALAVAAYLAAYALCLDRGPWRARAASLVPYLVVVVAWRVVYSRLGYGTACSGVYLDPGADPVAFARAAPSRIAFLLGSQLALPWSDLAELWRILSPRAYTAMLAVAVGVVAGAIALFAPLCRRDRLARFFAVGLAGAVVPIASTFPADRLLWFVGVGAMGLVARWLVLRPRARWASVVAALLVLVHVVLAAPLAALRARSNDTVGRPMLRAEASLPPSAALAGVETLVFVNPPADLFVGYVVILRAALGQPLPPAHWLATGTSPLHVARADERTLRVRADGGFYPFRSERMFRDLRRPFAVGQRVRTVGMTIEVTALMPDGRPSEVLARFDHALEDGALRWFCWRGHAFVPWTPPPVGAEVTLAPIDFVDAIFGK